jgi:hypothetical protein
MKEASSSEDMPKGCQHPHTAHNCDQIQIFNPHCAYSAGRFRSMLPTVIERPASEHFYFAENWPRELEISDPQINNVPLTIYYNTLGTGRFHCLRVCAAERYRALLRILRDVEFHEISSQTSSMIGSPTGGRLRGLTRHLGDDELPRPELAGAITRKASRLAALRHLANSGSPRWEDPSSRSAAAPSLPRRGTASESAGYTPVGAAGTRSTRRRTPRSTGPAAST